MSKKNLLFISILVALTGIFIIFITQASNQKTLFFILLLSLLVVLYSVVNHIKFLSTSFFFIVFYVMLFYIQPVVYFLTDGKYYFDFNEVKVLTLLIMAGCHLFLLGVIIFPTNKSNEMKSYNLDYKYIKKAVKWLLFLAASSIILLFLDAGTLNLLSLSRIELKNSGSIIRLFSTFLLYTSSIMFYLVFFTTHRRSKKNIFSWVIFLFFFEILIFLFFRTRSLMVAHISASLVGFYYSSLYLSHSKSIIKKSKKIIIVFMGAMLTFFAIISRFLRGYLEPSSNINNFSVDWKTYLQLSVEEGDLGYSGIVLKIIDLVPSTYPFFEGQSYYRLLYVFIPRFIWPDKPINTETIVGGWIDPGVEGLSIPPGIIGDLYMNFGIFGIVFMFVFGLIFSLFDRKVSVTNFMFWAVSATWVFHLVRGGFTNPIVIMVFLAVNILFIKKFIFSDFKIVR